MVSRKPQINFQVNENIKMLYDEAKASGHWVTRFCAAGFLMMVENPEIRAQAIDRLRDWEEEFENSTPEDIRAFVSGVRTAMQGAVPGMKRGLKARSVKKAAKRS